MTEGAASTLSTQSTHAVEQEIREAKEAHTLRTSLLEELRLERAQLRLERRLLEAALPEADQNPVTGTLRRARV